MEPKELLLLRVQRIGEEVLRRDMLWFHLPIVDVCIPADGIEHRLDVVVHCRGDLGRAGTIAARLLVELGVEPTRAIKAVREVRPGAIETCEQTNFVLNLAGVDFEDWFEELTGFPEGNYEKHPGEARGRRQQTSVACQRQELRHREVRIGVA
jgi:hypothetical protein